MAAKYTSILIATIFLVGVSLAKPTEIGGGGLKVADPRPYYATLVWLGDSITAYFQREGSPIWNEHYVPLGTLSFAIPGQTSSGTITQVQRDGVLDGLNSTVVVLMTGGNDLKQEGTLPATVIARVTNLVGLIKERQPQAKILLLGMLPIGIVPGIANPAISFTNAGYQALDNGDDIRFLGMLPEYCDASYNIHSELYVSDLVHLSRSGYELWQRTMDPLLQELLGNKV